MAGAGGGGSGDTSPTVVPVPSPIPTRRRPTNGNSRGRDWDRFIPNRSAMDMDYARYMLTEGNRTRGKNPDEEESDYCKILAKVMGQDRRSILSFGPKPPDPLGHLTPTQKVDFIVSDYYRSKKPQRLIPLKPERMFDLPDLLADDSLNLLDWGSRNILAVALADTLHLKVEQHIRELVTIPEDHGGPITSVSWDPDGRSLAVGLNSSDVQLWDAESNRLLRTFSGGHQPHSRVGSLAWKDHQILTSGGMDARVINNDVRTRSHVVQTYQGHAAEVCSLKWSASGTQLASGGNDNLVLIWDSSMASPARTQWLHKLEEHTGAVKGLAWCPFRHNLLASGGGVADHRIKFWNSTSGICLNTVDTGSQVCSLIWNTKERELLSSHGFPGNQLTLWKYPSMQKLAELSGHTSSVLFMTQSPNGCTVASASAGPETEALMLWNVFGNPEAPQSSQRTNELPFARRNYIR